VGERGATQLGALPSCCAVTTVTLRLIWLLQHPVVVFSSCGGVSPSEVQNSTPSGHLSKVLKSVPSARFYPYFLPRARNTIPQTSCWLELKLTGVARGCLKRRKRLKTDMSMWSRPERPRRNFEPLRPARERPIFREINGKQPTTLDNISIYHTTTKK
jgi:hypothetical protein